MEWGGRAKGGVGTTALLSLCGLEWVPTYSTKPVCVFAFLPAAAPPWRTPTAPPHRCHAAAADAVDAEPRPPVTVATIEEGIEEGGEQDYGINVGLARTSAELQPQGGTYGKAALKAPEVAPAQAPAMEE